MILLQQILSHKRSIIADMATWASVRGMTEILRLCYELMEAMDDEIKRLDKVDSTAKEEQ